MSGSGQCSALVLLPIIAQFPISTVIKQNEQHCQRGKKRQILHVLSLLCGFQVGLFRKSGVKSRIQALRQMNENSPDDVNYEDQSAYDVADMVKQFFRDLPEPLLTSKLGETFLHIYQCKKILISIMC